MGGDGKGKAAGKGAAPPAKAKAATKSKEELAEEARRKKEERQAAQAKKVAEEKAHLEWVAKLTTFTASGTEGIDWSAVEKQLLLPGGTSVCKMADGKVASVRRVDSPAMEMMAASLAAELGAKVGAYRAVHPKEAEYSAIEEMTAKAPTYLDDMSMDFETFIKEVKEGNTGDIPDEQKRLLRPYEFTEPARGAALVGFSQKRKGTVFVREFQQGKSLSNLCGTLGKDELKSMGQLAVLGALINAEDMSPLPIWRESGGLTHALKLDGKQDVLALDLRICPLQGEELVEYCKRIELMSSWLLGKKGKPEDLPKYPPFTEDAIKNSFSDLLKTSAWEAEDLGAYLDSIKACLKTVADGYASGSLQKALAEAQKGASQASPFGAAGEGASAAQCAKFLTATAAAVAGDLGPSTAKALTLYGAAASQPTRSCRFLLQEAGVEHEFVAVDVLKGEQKQEPYISVNPAGTVPALKDGDSLLGEAAWMLAYIAQKNSLTAWYPEDAKARAKVNFWLHWNHSNSHKSTVDMVSKLVAGEKTNSVETKKALDFLEQHLATGGPFLTGATPTIADLFILPEVDQIPIFKFFDLSPWPKVQAWVDATIAALPQSYETSSVEEVARQFIK